MRIPHFKHFKRGATGGAVSGVVISICSFAAERTPIGVKKVGRTIGQQVCADAIFEYADNSFQAFKVHVTFTRYVIKGKYILSCSSTADFAFRSVVVVVPEVCRAIGTFTPYKFMVMAGSALDAFIIKDMEKHILLESLNVKRLAKAVEFIELVPKYVKKSSIATKLMNFLELNGGAELKPILKPVKYVLRARPGTPPFQNPYSVFYKPMFKLKPLSDNYSVLEWVAEVLD